MAAAALVAQTRKTTSAHPCLVSTVVVFRLQVFCPEPRVHLAPKRVHVDDDSLCCCLQQQQLFVFLHLLLLLLLLRLLLLLLLLLEIQHALWCTQQRRRMITLRHGLRNRLLLLPPAPVQRTAMLLFDHRQWLAAVVAKGAVIRSSRLWNEPEEDFRVYLEKKRSIKSRQA